MRNQFFAVACLAAACGCVSSQSSSPIADRPLPKGSAQYAPLGEVESGNATDLTIYDLEAATGELLAKMRKNALFTQNYTKVKDAKGALPVIVVGNISNKTTSRIQNRLDMVRDIVTTSLYETNLFDVKDDTASDAIAARLALSEEGGLEDATLTSAFGDHESPDFMLIGDLTAFRDVGSIHTFKLKFAIQDLRTGKIVWQGIQTNIKL